jgi:hypothetical protein
MKFRLQDPSEYQKTLATLGISEEEYLNIINVILKTFPKDWVDSKLDEIDKKSNFMHLQLWPELLCGLRYNPIPMILGRAGGYMVIIQIIRLGRLILKAEQLPNKNEVIKKLAGKVDDYISTLFELETFEFFSKSGFSLNGSPEDDGVDYTFVKNGQKVFVEATHRGHSWVIEIFTKIGQSIKSMTEEPSKIFDKCIRLNYKTSNEFVVLNGVDKFVFDIDRVLDKTPKYSCIIEDKMGRFCVEFKESEEGKLNLKWYEPTDYAYEAVELFKGRINEKIRQLSLNDFSFCSIDMRSLVPPLVMRDMQYSVNICSEYMEKIFLAAHDFLRQNSSIAGIFVWVKHIGRNKNHIIDAMNQDEVILINEKRSLSDDMAKTLFPLAVLPKELTFYCEKGLFLP